MSNHYTNFSNLIENEVLPLRQKHPDWLRLDGGKSSDKRNTFATFEYHNKTWKIHSDTQFQALLSAWELEEAGKEPFTIAATKKGTPCLRISASLNTSANGLYIYLKK